MQESSVLLQHLQNIWGQNHMLRHHLLPWGQLHWPCISWPSVHVLYRQHALFGTVECQGWLLHAGKAKLACRHIWSNWACSDMQLFGHCTWPCGPYVLTMYGAETCHITVNKVFDGHHQELGFACKPLASASVSHKSKSSKIAQTLYCAVAVLELLQMTYWQNMLCNITYLKRCLLHKAILTKLCFHPHSCSPRALSTPFPPSNLHLLSPWWRGQIRWVCRRVPTSTDWGLCLDHRSFLGAWGIGGGFYGCSWVLGFRLDLCANVSLSVLHCLTVSCRYCVPQSDCMGLRCSVFVRRQAELKEKSHRHRHRHKVAL